MSMTSYERRVKRLHDHVMRNSKQAEEKQPELTVKEIQALLAEKGIEFDPKAKKAELLELLNENEKRTGQDENSNGKEPEDTE